MSKCRHLFCKTCLLAVFNSWLNDGRQFHESR
ncbi:MAG: hypothetical protein HYZ14_07210 [Bacteroidetes bacterium]|nr:hypothetical protein [Bacteroidota bacterium]